MRLSRFILILSLCCGLSYTASADIVTDWNTVTLQTIRAAATPPPRAARVLAMVHVAIFDAVNTITRGHRPYLVDTNVSLDTSREAAVAQAAYTVLINLYPAQQAAFDVALAQSLAAVPDRVAKTAGIALGETVGASVLTWRNMDGSEMTVPYAPGGNPGDWLPTPPGFAPALFPQWPLVAPFAMSRGDQFRSAGPPRLHSLEYTLDFNEVKNLGSAQSVARTEDQTHIALFWADGAGTVTPPGHWNRIAQTVAATHKTTLGENARLFALLNIALADAAICAWDMKYMTNLWRPVTAIRQADLDGNPDTEADPSWTSLLVTPPFPTYVSGHSAFSAAAAKILALFFGTDQIAFTDHSEGVDGSRSFTSFSEAANEAGRSRIYGGIHYEFDNQDGQTGGRLVGALVYSHYLQPTLAAAVAHLQSETAAATMPERHKQLLMEILDNAHRSLELGLKQLQAGKRTAARLRLRTTKYRIAHYLTVLHRLEERGQVGPEIAAALQIAADEIQVQLTRLITSL